MTTATLAPLSRDRGDQLPAGKLAGQGMRSAIQPSALLDLLGTPDPCPPCFDAPRPPSAALLSPSSNPVAARSPKSTGPATTPLPVPVQVTQQTSDRPPVPNPARSLQVSSTDLITQRNATYTRTRHAKQRETSRRNTRKHAENCFLRPESPGLSPLPRDQTKSGKQNSHPRVRANRRVSPTTTAPHWRPNLPGTSRPEPAEVITGFNSIPKTKSGAWILRLPSPATKGSNFPQGSQSGRG